MLYFPVPLRGLPRSKDDALAVALRRNPTLLAADSDKEAAKQAFRATDGAFVPSVSLEGRASHSIDADTFIGKRDDIAGKVVVSWDIFRGGQDSWRRAEMAERYTEETMRQARLQRDALESVDKAWAARTITVEPHRRVDASACRRQENHRDLSQGVRDQTALADRPPQRRKPVFQRRRLADFSARRGRLCRLSAAGGHGIPARLPKINRAGTCRGLECGVSSVRPV